MSNQSPPAARFSAIHAFGLASFAIPVPLFLVLSASPEFFLAHGFTPARILVFAVALGWGVPAVCALVVAALNVVGIAVARLAAWIIAGTLAILACLPTLNRIAFLPAALAIVLSFLVGATLVFVYSRHRIVREYLTLLCLVALIAPLWMAWRLDVFAARSAPKIDAAAAASDARPPVVWLMFDEFSLEALLQDDGEIDAANFPNFAALAATSLWVRDATAVAEMTTEAIPAQLTGRYPRDGQKTPPLYLYYPENAMTILHAAGYRVFARELLTRLCPPAINSVQGVGPAPWAPFIDDVGVVFAHLVAGPLVGPWLPDIRRQVAHFRVKSRDVPVEGRRVQQIAEPIAYRRGLFDDFVADIDGTEGEFHYLHLNIPHQEYFFLGSGRAYALGTDPEFTESFVGSGAEGRFGDEFGTRTAEPYPVALARQRYLLQVQYADRLLGRLLARLREVDAFVPTLLLVTADHGISFRPGRSDRLAVAEGRDTISDPDHARDIVKVPLFIKFPGAQDARRIDRPAETVDVLATLLDSLGFAQRHTDGASLLAEMVERSEYHLYSEANRRMIAHSVKFDSPGYLEARSEWNQRTDNFRPKTAWDELLLHRRIADMEILPDPVAGVRVAVHRESDFADVELASGFIPAYVNAEMKLDPGVAAPAAVAVSLNGRIEAIAVPFSDAQGRLWARAMIPESSLAAGRNEIRIWAVVDSGERLLAPIAGGQAP